MAQKIYDEAEMYGHMPACGFCTWEEQGKHGEVRREWSHEWMMFLPLCRTHSLEPDEEASE